MFDEGVSWAELTDTLLHHFSGKTWWQVRNKVRDYIRGLPEYEQRHLEGIPERSSIEYCKDGSLVSEKFIMLKDGVDMTPEVILTAHGLDIADWEVVSYKNNFWNTQVKGGTKQISYQSKLTVKPRKTGVDFEAIKQRFAELERVSFEKPLVAVPEGSLMAEVNIADFHIGKLCWRGDTPENYDHKIARDLFYRIVGGIVAELRGRPIEQILFVWSNDFFNSDNEAKTTTAGTPQDTDVRSKKLFNVGWEMLIRAIEMLAEVAPVKTFYTPSNHDEETAYHALGVLSAWFRFDERVEVDLDAYPRKYELYGNTLIGFTHGNKENDRGGKEKASRLASLMPIEAKEFWGKARYYEMHAAHLHSEQMIQEINGVIVRRIASPTATDTYHTNHGYMGAVRKAQTFIYDRVRGLVQIINTPV